MNKEYVKWYGKCVESLFFGHKDSWVCRKVVELSAGIEKKPKEEIIKDTKFRFRALLDYTLDVFTGDRMENKSYQLSFAMYYVARCMFPESVAAIASEAIMSVANWDYRVRSNILRFILFDDNAEEAFIQKMTIFFMALEETKALENTHVSDCSGISFAEFYPELIGEIEHLDYEHGSRIKLQTPEVLEPVYGILDSSVDCYGYWYHFLCVEDKECDYNTVKKLMEEDKIWEMHNNRQVDIIDLSYPQLDMHERFLTYDWIERADEVAGHEEARGATDAF